MMGHFSNFYSTPPASRLVNFSSFFCFGFVSYLYLSGQKSIESLINNSIVFFQIFVLSRAEAFPELDTIRSRFVYVGLYNRPQGVWKGNIYSLIQFSTNNYNLGVFFEWKKKKKKKTGTSKSLHLQQLI